MIDGRIHRDEAYTPREFNIFRYQRIETFHMHEFTGFQRDLLYIIAELDSPSGLAVKEHLDEYYSSKINHGRLYPNLDILVDAGLVEKGTIDDRTNSYTLTDKGKQLLAERRQWENDSVTLFQD